MRSKPHQFVIVMKISRADGLCFLFSAWSWAPCKPSCKSSVGSPFISKSAHTHAGFIYTFSLPCHIYSRMAVYIHCTLYTACTVLLFIIKKINHSQTGTFSIWRCVPWADPWNNMKFALKSWLQGKMVLRMLHATTFSRFYSAVRFILCIPNTHSMDSRNAAAIGFPFVCVCLLYYSYSSSSTHQDLFLFVSGWRRMCRDVKISTVLPESILRAAT